MSEKVIENRWNCGRGIWKKFSENQQEIYNNVRSYKQSIVVHPKTALPKVEWDTISHNFACIAAWESEGDHSVIKEQKKRKTS